MSVCLEAQALSVAYGTRTILSDVSLRVEAGEIVALIGPNGAGKTTLLKALAGLLKPTAGAVQLASGARTAYLAQSEALPSEWLARDLVELGRLPSSGFWRSLTPRDRAAVESAMRRTDSWAFAEQRLARLSGGERQRVALARALAQEPTLLLLDEPTTHLDPRHQAELLGTLKREATRGVASVVVMHDLTLAGEADRCILLTDGKVNANGAAAEVLRADLLSAAYRTEIDVLQAADGRRAVLLRSSGQPRSSFAPRTQEPSA